MHRCLPFVLLSFLAVGCKHVPSRAECKTHEGTVWRELTSEHFNVVTNLDSEAAKVAVIELEKARRGLLFAWRDQVDPPGRLDAVVLQSTKQLEEFAKQNVIGFMTTDARGPIIVLGGDSYAFNASPDRSLVTHELAHHLSSYVLLRQPRWFAEGLATYLEMTRPYGDGSQVRLGEAHPEMLIWAKTHARVPLEDLWRWKGNTDLREAETFSYYATSWLWVHFLINQRQKEFADFQARLQRAQDPKYAWEEAFKDVDPSRLQLDLNQYLDQGTYSAIRVKMPQVPEATSERVLSDGEVHSVRARLFRLGAKRMKLEERLAAIQEESRRAFELSPDAYEVMAAKWASTKAGPERLAFAQEIVKKYPESAEAWMLMRRSLPKEAAQERRDALVKAVQFDPSNPRALNSLAWDYALNGQAKVALPLAQKAVKLSPWSPGIIDTYAAALAGAGRCPEAVATQHRAIDMLHESVPAEDRKDYEGRLALYEAGCKQPIGATAADDEP